MGGISDAVLWAIFWAITTLPAIYISSLFSDIARGDAPAVKSARSKVIAMVRGNPIAFLALFGVVFLGVYTYLSGKDAAPAREVYRIFGPYKLQVCKDRVEPYPISDTLAEDYVLLLGQTEVDSRIEAANRGDNALFGFSVSKSDKEGSVLLSSKLEVNEKVGGENSDKYIRDCKDLGDDSRKTHMSQMFVEVFLLYPKPEQPPRQSLSQ